MVAGPEVGSRLACLQVTAGTPLYLESCSTVQATVMDANTIVEAVLSQFGKTYVSIMSGI